MQGLYFFYNHSQDLLARFGDRLLITHLNDNLGIRRLDGDIFWHDDLHLLPGDGTLDWKEAVRKLNTAKRQEILNFELKIRPKGDRCKLDLYSKMPLQEYLQLAYERASQVSKEYWDK